MSDYEMYELGDVALQSGLTPRQAKLAYKTYGQLNSARDNVIVMPTFYGGQHTDTEAMMSAGRALDPKKYFIIFRFVSFPRGARRAGISYHSKYLVSLFSLLRESVTSSFIL